MANTIPSEKWLSVIQQEYLQRFVRRGGAAVKFAVLPEESQCQKLIPSLRGIAEEENYYFAPVDVAATKAHMVDKMFFAIAQQIPWDELTMSFLRSTLSKEYFLPEDQSLSIEALASANSLEIREMRRNVNNRLQNILARDHRMTLEFRIAMVRLCQSLLDTESTSPGESEAVKQWLRGELRLISALKKAFIFQKIGRHNARDMIYSLCHWLHLTGKAGLVVTIDISRYLKPRRQKETDGSLYYGPTAVLDGYEVLRQFIDSTDELEFCLVVVLAPQTFLTDDYRGVLRYEALRLRISDEVHDLKRVNPLSALVRHGEVKVHPDYLAAQEELS
ncbi:MAG: DUF2791 family P-loop domain-containing protein [Dehalococcoidia bacterium]|nr:DUF2791 family P-loop domain-containing protein [Dehalococcoidia bacterium]